jgi:predicted DNA-binding transcriptional regulator YafY
VKFERVLGILVSLLAREKTTAQGLADRWGVSVRTVYRDLRSLEEAGIPLVTAPGPRGGVDLVEGYTLDRHLLRPDELSRLREALAGLGRVFPDEAVRSGQRKLAGLAPVDDEVVYLDLDGWSSPDGSGDLGRLADACRHGRVLRATYLDSEGRRSQRDLEPLTLVWRTRWYLFAWCRLRSDYRLFRAASLEVAPTGERVPRRPGTYAALKAAQKEASLATVTVRFSSAKAHLVPPAPRGRDTVVEADGRVRVTVDLRPEDVYEYCARWGADLEVLAPADLRTRFAAEAQRLHAVYDPKIVPHS